MREPSEIRRRSGDTLMPIYVEDVYLGHRRDMIMVALNVDVSFLCFAGLRFPHVVGREVEGGGVIIDGAREVSS
jgi:hypothetical protein